MGICGTAMGTLAGILKNQGLHVVGSDQNTYPPMSDQLGRQGIKILSPFNKGNIGLCKPDLVIVGNVISKSNPEVEELFELNIPYLSMPQALHHFFLHQKKVIVISGTHGKTTTTALMAHILEQMGEDPSWLVAGVTRNERGNFHIGSGDVFVIEGDEYDTSFFDKGPKFLHYNPLHVIMTSLEFDHADIYQDIEHIVRSFTKLSQLIPTHGTLHVNDSYPRLEDAVQVCKASVTHYGQNATDWRIRHYKPLQSNGEQGSSFDIYKNDTKIISVITPLSGLYNAENVTACLSVIVALGLDLNKAVATLPSFKGVARRQDVLFSSEHTVLIDDFAHHPTAVKKTILAIKEKYPRHHLTAVFEPRSNTSRRAVFQNDFTEAFLCADAVIIGAVSHPEKVPDGKILDVDLMAKNLSAQGCPAQAGLSTTEIVEHLIKTKENPRVFLVMSNGSFDGLNQKLLTKLKEA